MNNKNSTFLISSYEIAIIAIALSLIGTLIQSISYFSYDPVILTFIFFFIGFIIVNIFQLPSQDKLFFYFYLSLSIFFSGITAIFFNQLGVKDFNTPDAANFHRWAAIYDWLDNYSLFDTRVHNSRNFTEGGLAIYSWRFIYNILNSIGLDKGHYIGIYVNNLLVALTGLISLRTVSLIYNKDKIKKRMFALLFTLASIHILYASILLRDSYIIFFISILFYFWMKTIKQVNIYNVLNTVLISCIISFLYIYLRTEYYYLPIVFFFIAILSKILSSKFFNNFSISNILFIVIISLAATALIHTLVPGIYEAIINGYNNYNNVIFEYFPKETSLGTLFIIDIPIYLRALVGPIYLFMFPIPVWSGFFAGNGYQLLISMHSLFMHFWIPLLLFSIYHFIKSKKYRTSELYFCILIFFIFTIGVALTSIDTRHLGNFLFIGIIFSLIGLEIKKKDTVKYYLLYLFWLVSVASIHFLWFLLKFV